MVTVLVCRSRAGFSTGSSLAFFGRVQPWPDSLEVLMRRYWRRNTSSMHTSVMDDEHLHCGASSLGRLR